MAALACGMISVGSCNGDVTSTILQTLMEKSESDLKSTFARFLALGLALTYLGKQESADAILAALQVSSFALSHHWLIFHTCCIEGLNCDSRFAGCQRAGEVYG
jgi:hypothetical protein